MDGSLLATAQWKNLVVMTQLKFVALGGRLQDRRLRDILPQSSNMIPSIQPKLES